MAEVKVEEVSQAEGRVMFDNAARRLLDVSGDEFVVRWDRGDYEGDDRLAVMKVAMLLPFAR